MIITPFEEKWDRKSYLVFHQIALTPTARSGETLGIFVGPIWPRIGLLLACFPAFAENCRNQQQTAGGFGHENRQQLAEALEPKSDKLLVFDLFVLSRIVAMVRRHLGRTNSKRTGVSQYRRHRHGTRHAAAATA